MSVFYTVAEIAGMLRVNVTKVGTWINRGELDAINVGNGQRKPRYRISQEAFDRFQESRTQAKSVAKVRRKKTYTGRRFIK